MGWRGLSQNQVPLVFVAQDALTDLGQLCSARGGPQVVGALLRVARRPGSLRSPPLRRQKQVSGAGGREVPPVRAALPLRE